MGGIHSKSNETSAPPLVFLGTPQVDRFDMRVSGRLANLLAGRGPTSASSASTGPAAPTSTSLSTSASADGHRFLEREHAEIEALMRRLDHLSKHLPLSEQAWLMANHDASSPSVPSSDRCSCELDAVMTCYDQHPKRALECHDRVRQFQQCVASARDALLSSAG